MKIQNTAGNTSNRRWKRTCHFIRDGGFTLVEVMVSTSIVALLVATAVPAYKDYILRAEITEGLAILGSKKSAISEYYAGNNTMPQYLEDLGWPSNRSPDPGRSNSYKKVFGGRSELWLRIGVNSNVRNGKDQYVDMYLRTRPLAALNNQRGNLYIQAKAIGTGVEFRCSVSSIEMMSIVPSPCATVRGNFKKW